VISDRLATVGSSIRASIDTALELGDQGTADLFIEISRAIDKQLWLAEAHLQA
jgi:starvation-inducible DNA-binding protein